MIIARCAGCGLLIMPKLAWTGETLWVDGASSSFNCYGSIKHRLDVPGDLEPETVRGWLA